MIIFKKFFLLLISVSIIVIIFTTTLTNTLVDVNRLPSEFWSKEMKFSEIDQENNESEYNKNSVVFYTTEDAVNVFYSKSNILKYKKFNLSFNLLEEGDLIESETEIENIYVFDDGNKQKLIIESQLNFTFYEVTSDLNVITRLNNYQLENSNYCISNGNLITRLGDQIRIINADTVIDLSLLGNFYSVESSLSIVNDKIKLSYVSMYDGYPTIVLSTYEKNGTLINHEVISRLTFTEQRLKINNLTSYETEETVTIMVNITDMKKSIFYLNYFKYSLKDQELLVTDDFIDFRDVMNTINEGEIICTVGGEYILDEVGEKYFDSKNLVLANFEDREYFVMTRTFQTPIQYFYSNFKGSNYLIWSEVYDGVVNLYYSTDSTEIIQLSQRTNPERMKLAIEETISKGMIVPVFIFIIVIYVFTIVVLPILAFYFMKYSIIERNTNKFLVFMIITHNIVILTLNSTLNKSVEMPSILNELLPIFIIVLNIISFYYYSYYKKEKNINNLILNYITYSIPYIVIYSSTLFPFVDFF